jgi:S-adenosylmethionine synthetase
MSDGEIAKKVQQIFDMRPAAIEKRLKLRNPIFQETAAYGHMGKKPRTVTKKFESSYFDDVEKEVELFTWEKLDFVDEIKRVFEL